MTLEDYCLERDLLLDHSQLVKEGLAIARNLHASGSPPPHKLPHDQYGSINGYRRCTLDSWYEEYVGRKEDKLWWFYIATNTTTAKGVEVWGRELGPPRPGRLTCTQARAFAFDSQGRRVLNPDEPKKTQQQWRTDHAMDARRLRLNPAFLTHGSFSTHRRRSLMHPDNTSGHCIFED